MQVAFDEAAEDRVNFGLYIELPIRNALAQVEGYFRGCIQSTNHATKYKQLLKPHISYIHTHLCIIARNVYWFPYIHEKWNASNAFGLSTLWL